MLVVVVVEVANVGGGTGRNGSTRPAGGIVTSTEPSGWSLKNDSCFETSRSARNRTLRLLMTEGGTGTA